VVELVAPGFGGVPEGIFHKGGTASAAEVRACVWLGVLVRDRRIWE
jgi:hypothetical protein